VKEDSGEAACESAIGLFFENMGNADRGVACKAFSKSPKKKVYIHDEDTAISEDIKSVADLNAYMASESVDIDDTDFRNSIDTYQCDSKNMSKDDWDNIAQYAKTKRDTFNVTKEFDVFNNMLRPAKFCCIGVTHSYFENDKRDTWAVVLDVHS
jgi:hypothetical protein